MLTPARVAPGPGLVVTEMQSGSAAAQASIRQADVLREVTRALVRSMTDVEQTLARSRDKNVLLRVERAEGSARYVLVELGCRRDGPFVRRRRLDCLRARLWAR